jgi:tetratricopeptide (TPR) repeat protein
MLIARCRFLGVAVVAVLVLVAGCRRDPAEAAKAHIDRGEQLLASGQYQAASVEFRNAIELDGTIGVARFGLAKAYANMNDVARARVEFVRAADLMPNDVAVQVAAAQALLRSGEFQDARARAIKAVELDPKNLDAYLVMGSAAAGLRDLDAAMKAFQEGLSNNPSRPELLVNLGSVQIGRGQQSDAEGYFKQAVAMNPQSVTARLALANFYSSSGRLTEAESAINEALQLDRNGVPANNAYVALLMATGRAAEAEAPLRIVAEASGDAAQKLRLADFYVSQKRQPEAEVVLRELAANPKVFAAATSRLAAISYESGQVDRAHAQLNEILQKQPANAEVLVVKSRWLLSEQKFDEAFAAANAAIKAEPNSWGAHEALGATRAAKRNSAEALSAYAEAIRLNPNATNSTRRMGRSRTLSALRKMPSGPRPSVGWRVSRWFEHCWLRATSREPRPSFNHSSRQRQRTRSCRHWSGSSKRATVTTRARVRRLNARRPRAPRRRQHSWGFSGWIWRRRITPRRRRASNSICPARQTIRKVSISRDGHTPELATSTKR